MIASLVHRTRLPPPLPAAGVARVPPCPVGSRISAAGVERVLAAIGGEDVPGLGGEAARTAGAPPPLRSAVAAIDAPRARRIERDQKARTLLRVDHPDKLLESV
jgi:hypothetical protein